MNLAFIDLILVGVFGLFVFLGFKNGMIRSLLLFLGSVAAWFFSIYISKGVANFIYVTFIAPSVVDNTSKLLSSHTLQTKLIFDSLPGFISNSLPSYGITQQKITHIINSASKDALPTEISNALMPGITEVLKPMIAVVAFVLLAVLVRFLVKIVLKIFKFKILNYGDKILGAVFGALKGAVVVLVGLCVLKVSVSLSDSSDFKAFVEQASDQTVIFGKVYSDNYLYDLIRKI